MTNREGRDFQRSKVYKAEEVLEHFGVTFTSVKSMQEYCDKLIKSDLFKERYSDINKIIVGDGRGRRRACGFRSESSIKIKIPVWCRTHHMILHEITHGLVTENMKYGHGSNFCKTYLLLVETFMGEVEACVLRDSFKSNGVIYGNQYDTAGALSFFEYIQKYSIPSLQSTKCSTIPAVELMNPLTIIESFVLIE